MHCSPNRYNQDNKTLQQNPVNITVHQTKLKYNIKFLRTLSQVNQLRTGKMRVICSKETLSDGFFLSSGWLNSLGGSKISCERPWLFSITQPEFATWYSRNLSSDSPSMFIACFKHQKTNNVLKGEWSSVNSLVTKVLSISN